jgi:hypothetical protein
MILTDNEDRFALIKRYESCLKGGKVIEKWALRNPLSAQSSDVDESG